MPELAVLLAYTKSQLYEELLASDVPEDPSLGQELDRYFPDSLRRFAAQIADHPLRREIIATRVANTVVNLAGTTFAYRLAEETGMGAADIARAHTAARKIFGQPDLWTRIKELDGTVSTDAQIGLFLEVRRVVERASRWLLRSRFHPLDIAATVDFFAPGVPELTERLPELLDGRAADELQAAVGSHRDNGVPEALARQIAALPATFAILDIGDVAAATNRPLLDVAAVHFELGQQLLLDWLRQQILELPRDDRWQALARGALRDSLHTVHASLTTDVLRRSGPGSAGRNEVQRWIGAGGAATSRCVRVLDDIARGSRSDLATLTVALREVGALVQARPAGGASPPAAITPVRPA